ncbi:hypothetical protein HPB48_021987 [Haemaphysalis longicornis]|uniref:Endonuclease/exonuclease/phosphatase domain-containing protein n=1 Tax=Haemaphysalis longicornis TaxID=44386 RepID=A0A9J6FDI9_HAELO|nr:hypothetical protein HPB48_021987 [Haemaphysalis longicornis]
MIEIVPNVKCSARLFILNVYDSPSDYKQSFNTLISKAATLATDVPIVMAGDFNAAHEAWGYQKTTVQKKGSRLLQAVTDCSFNLITDPQFPTRIGTSVTRDTTPDLTFRKNIQEATWRNTLENLGSDHYILATTLQVGAQKPRQHKIVDWDAFRRICKEDQTEYETLKDLLDRLKTDVAAATKTVEAPPNITQMDARLANLLEARNSIQARWRKQRLNRRLRKKTAELNRKIEEHALILNTQKWDEICALTDGRMRMGGKWNLLKKLIDDKQWKGNQQLALDKLMHNLRTSGMTNENIFDKLASIYLSVGLAAARTRLAEGGRRAPQPSQMSAQCTHLKAQGLHDIGVSFSLCCVVPAQPLVVTLPQLPQKSMGWVARAVREGVDERAAAEATP